MPAKVGSEIAVAVALIVAFVILGALYVNLKFQPVITQNSSAQSAISQSETGTFTALDLLVAGIGVIGAIGLIALVAKLLSGWGSPSGGEEV